MLNFIFAICSLDDCQGKKVSSSLVNHSVTHEFIYIHPSMNTPGEKELSALLKNRQTFANVAEMEEKAKTSQA